MKLTLTDKLRLLSKGDISFLSRGFSTPTVIGDHQFQLLVRQTPTISPTSHLNCLILQTQVNQSPVRCEIKWFRVNKDGEQQVGEGELYQFQVDDIGWVIKGSITHSQFGKANVLLGPILIDPSVRGLLEGNLARGASKFILTLKRISVHGDEDIQISEISGINIQCSLFITNRQLKLVGSAKSREIASTIDFSISNPNVILEEDRQFSLRFISDSALDFVEQLQPQRYDRASFVDLGLEATSHVQRDLLILTLRLFAAKQHVETYKFLEALDRHLSEHRSIFASIEVGALKLPGDMLSLISAQSCQIKHLNDKNEALERQIVKAHLQVKQFEQEIQETIESYQQVLSSHNINHTTIKSLHSYNGDSSTLKLMHDKMNILKAQVEVLQQQSVVESVFIYTGESKEQLIAKINEIEQKLSNSRRLNELLNEELKYGKNPSDDLLYLQAENQQLRLENDLVHVYHKQMMQQEAQIQELKQLYQNQGPNEELEQENKDLRRQIESLRTQLYQQQSLNNSVPEASDEQKERLEEQCRALQRKNESLLKELDLLIKSPNQIRILQQQAAQNQLDATIRDLQNKVEKLNDENTSLKEQLQQYAETASQKHKNQLSNRFGEASTKLQQPSEPGQHMRRSSNDTSPIGRIRSGSSHHHAPPPIFEQLPPFPQQKSQKSNIFPSKYELIPRQLTRRSRHELSTSQDYSQQKDNSVLQQYEQLIKGSYKQN